jgi:hypothetical protein
VTNAKDYYFIALDAVVDDVRADRDLFAHCCAMQGPASVWNIHRLSPAANNAPAMRAAALGLKSKM